MEKKIDVFVNPDFCTEEEGRQLSEAIAAFKEGKEQPEGRFKILGTLPKEE